MSLVRVNSELRHRVHEAMQEPFRFERHERFAMRQLLQSGAGSDLAEQVFVDTARHALGRHGTVAMRRSSAPTRRSAAIPA